MSSRGRGFSSRGGGSSYRGRGGGGGGGGSSDWGSGNSGGSVSRGGYSSSRGSRFKYSTQSYDSRNKYTSGGGSEKYSSRGGRGDHSNSYKRPRDSYSTREEHRSSSESNRKRMRSDSYQGGGSGGSQRYSSSYGGSSASGQYEDNKRSSSSAAYEDKRQSDRSSSYHRDDRHSASRNYAPAPPPPPRISEMAPPSARYGTSSRGRISHGNTSFRGRISSRGGRGFHRVGTRTSDSLMTRKRTLTSLDYRRKILGSRSRDYIQRVRMTTTKLRRSGGTTRLTRSKKEAGTSSSVKDKDREIAKAINAEFSDDEKDEEVESNWDEEKPHEDEDEEVTTEKKSKETKRKKEKPENAKVEDEEKEEEEEEGKEDEEVEKPEEEDDETQDDENPKGERTAGSEELPSRRDGKRFIKLNCPHCSHRSVTFKEYSLHLFSGRHNSVMRRIAARHKATLARMRVVQRQEQRRVEVRDASRGTLPARTMFCPICKLNYRSLKAMHHLSESHRQMKRFLTPFCRVCRIQFRSPMLFESHVCSLDHIKRKSLVDERLNKRNGEAEADSSGPEEDDKEVNLDNFMTLDSVGDVDAEEEDEAAATAAIGEKKKKDKPENTEAVTTTTTTTTTTSSTTCTAEPEKKPKNKQMIKVGLEYIKRVEVQFCELCKIYLPRNENSERAVAMHCSTRSHLKRYVRDNDDKALRRQAERIHLQTSTSTSSTGSNATNTMESSKMETNQADGTNGANNSAPTVSNSNNGNSGETNEESVVVNDTSNLVQEPTNEVKNVKGENNIEEEDDDEYRADLGDKLWDDVDKDLGDILREAEPSTKSSDDEDSRYDRFRNSEKNSQLAKDKERSEGKEASNQEANKTEIKIKTEKNEK